MSRPKSVEFKDVKIDGEEVSEEQQAIDELAQIRFDPSMLEELNRIVDDATLGASRSSPRGEDSKMT